MINPVGSYGWAMARYEINAKQINNRAMENLKKHPEMKLSQAVEVTISDEAKELYLQAQGLINSNE